MLVTETPTSKWNISQYFDLDDLHSTTNEIYLSYFTLDSLKHTLPYYFYLVERFLKLSSILFGLPQAYPVMLIEWDLFVPVSLNSDRFTVPHEPLCPGLPYVRRGLILSCCDTKIISVVVFQSKKKNLFSLAK